MGGTPWCEITDFTTNFGRFREPQAWEFFWDEWLLPESTDVREMFSSLGWNVIPAQPEEYL